MKAELEELLAQALQRLQGNDLDASDRARAPIVVERTRDAQHGDYASNVALRLAKAARRKPRELARSDRRGAAGERADRERPRWPAPGFINFYLARGAHGKVLRSVLEQGERYGRSTIGAGKRVLVEFVSANPTGPLHVGHGRQAAYGATLANLLSATGYRRAARVLHQRRRAAGRHPRGERLAALPGSAAAKRCRSRTTATAATTSTPIGEQLRARTASSEASRGRGAAKGSRADAPAGDKEQYIDALIARMRELLGPRSLPVGAGARARRDARRHPRRPRGIRRAIRHLVLRARAGARRRGRARARAPRSARATLYTKDGALWLRSDRLRRRARIACWCAPTASKTYFAPDLAYHLDKRERGFAAADRRAGARTITATSRACAPGSWRMGEHGRLPRSLPDAVREPVPRRREDRRWASATASS